MAWKASSTSPGQRRFGRDAPESGLVVLTSGSSGFDPQQTRLASHLARHAGRSCGFRRQAAQFSELQSYADCSSNHRTANVYAAYGGGSLSDNRSSGRRWRDHRAGRARVPGVVTNGDDGITEDGDARIGLRGCYPCNQRCLARSGSHGRVDPSANRGYHVNDR